MSLCVKTSFWSLLSRGVINRMNSLLPQIAAPGLPVRSTWEHSQFSTNFISEPSREKNSILNQFQTTECMASVRVFTSNDFQETHPADVILRGVAPSFVWISIRLTYSFGWAPIPTTLFLCLNDVRNLIHIKFDGRPVCGPRWCFALVHQTLQLICLQGFPNISSPHVSFFLTRDNSGSPRTLDIFLDRSYFGPRSS